MPRRFVSGVRGWRMETGLSELNIPLTVVAPGKRSWLRRFMDFLIRITRQMRLSLLINKRKAG